jgi:hypothetical protein
VIWWTGLFVGGLLLNEVLPAVLQRVSLSLGEEAVRVTATMANIVWIAAAIATIAMMTHVTRSQHRLASKWLTDPTIPPGGLDPNRSTSSFLGPLGPSTDGDDPTNVI